MFTGIVERTVRVSALTDHPGRRVLSLEIAAGDSPVPWAPAVAGESIALSGVCLTVVAVRKTPRGEVVSFDSVPETLKLTTLGRLRPGDLVNVERSLRVGDSFGGHYVTGHVDGVGTVVERRAEGDQITFWIQVPRPLIRQILKKGSVAVDGVSLTVVDVDRSRGAFSFAAIPHTVDRTTLCQRSPGSDVNVETDAFGKWVLHAMGNLEGDARLGAESHLDAGSHRDTDTHRENRAGADSEGAGRGDRFLKLLRENGYDVPDSGWGADRP
jgi:riboflavin synthase